MCWSARWRESLDGPTLVHPAPASRGDDGGAMTTETLGHACVLSETNTHGWIPLCECGWIGAVHQHVGYTGDETESQRSRIATIRDSASAEHRVHLVEIEAELVAQHAAALDAHAAYVEAVRPTFTRIGRWGSG